MIDKKVKGILLMSWCITGLVYAGEKRESNKREVGAVKQVVKQKELSTEPVIKQIQERFVIFKNKAWGVGSFSEHYIRRLCAVIGGAGGVYALVCANESDVGAKGAKTQERERTQKPIRGELDHLFSEDFRLGSRLIEAVQEGDAQRVQELIRAGAPINFQYFHGETPLMEASSRNFVDIVTLLLGQGAGINIQDIHGSSALQRAARSHQPNADKIITLLLEAQADVDMSNKYGFTALHNASCFSRPHAMRLLILAGANTEIKNENGCTPWNMCPIAGLSSGALSIEQKGEVIRQALGEREARRLAREGVR